MKEGAESEHFVHFLVKHRFELIFFCVQAVLVVLFGLFTTYGSAGKLALEASAEDAAGAAIYPLYQDINVMMFLGFGFLMTFLRSHAWTSIGLNFLISVLVIQVYILSAGFWMGVVTGEWHLIEINIETLVLANFCVASVLIAFGGVLGKMSPFQLMAMALCQTFLYALNEAIFFEELKGVDAGGSIVIHSFGAYFGLTATWVMVHSSKKCKTEALSHSNLFSWIGTLFLWVYWPSFNSAIAVYSGQTRAVVNTVLALCGSTLATYLTSALFHQTKFCIEDVLNATLAGGVAMGSSADLILHPYGGLLVGLAAGIVSTVGYNKLMPFLQKKLKLFDTCGINNLHGMPGIIGGLTSVIVLGTMEDPNFEEVFGRTQRKQALMQLAGLGISLGIAIFGGLLVSLTSKLKLCKLPKSLYNDDEWWDLREVEVDDPTVVTAIRRRKTLELDAMTLQPRTGTETQPNSPKASHPVSPESERAVEGMDEEEAEFERARQKQN